MRYETRVGLRFTRAGARQNRQGANPFISFISLISILGMALGVAALIVVLSVMNGFQKELRTRILGVASHIQVTARYADTLSDWPAVVQAAQAQPEVLAAAPYVQEQSMLAMGDRVRGALIRGIDPAQENRVADFAQHMVAGSWQELKAGSFGIVLGADLAYALRVGLGDKLTLIAPQGLVTPAAVLPRIKQFRVVGIFDVGMYEYDSGLALIQIEDAQTLYRMQGVSGVRLKTNDLFAAPRIGRNFAAQLAGDYRVTDWTQSHANFFRAVAIEKKMMFLILLLVVAVAAFNIVSALVMAVTEKQSDIAILRTMGARAHSIMRIFVVQGAIIGCIGLVAGVASGVALALNIDVVVPFIERVLGIRFLAKDVYYITDLPSDLQWSDVAIVTGAAFVLTLLATLYPSWRASRVRPAQALRYD